MNVSVCATQLAATLYHTIDLISIAPNLPPVRNKGRVSSNVYCEEALNTTYADLHTCHAVDHAFNTLSARNNHPSTPGIPKGTNNFRLLPTRVIGHGQLKSLRDLLDALPAAISDEGFVRTVPVRDEDSCNDTCGSAIVCGVDGEGVESGVKVRNGVGISDGVAGPGSDYGSIDVQRIVIVTVS